MELGNDQSSAEARRKREEALRALAEGAPASAEAAMTGRASEGAPPSLRPAPRQGRPRWALPLVSAVALLAVVAVVVAHFLPATPAATRHIPAKLALDPETYGIACLQDAAWSPDSREIAILGTQQSCSMPIPEFYTY